MMYLLILLSLSADMRSVVVICLRAASARSEQYNMQCSNVCISLHLHSLSSRGVDGIVYLPNSIIRL